MVDDIQFIATRERTQEEFFHTFNALYDQQKQIVISSDCPPKEISAIEERLRSRFEWGLIADIQPPDLETKIAILQKKAENERVRLADDVAEYIARSIKSNVRELEGALIRLIAFASLTGAEVNLATAQQVLKNIIEIQEKKVTIEQIQKRVGEHFGLRAQDLKIRSNSKVIAFPRQVAMFLVKQLTSASLPEIGRQFGGKHHTTVLHSIHKIENIAPRGQRFEQDDQQATRLIRMRLARGGPARRALRLLIRCGRAVNPRGFVGYDGGRGGTSAVLPRRSISIHSFANHSMRFPSAVWSDIRNFHSCGDDGGVLSLS